MEFSDDSDAIAYSDDFSLKTTDSHQCSSFAKYGEDQEKGL